MRDFDGIAVGYGDDFTCPGNADGWNEKKDDEDTAGHRTAHTGLP